MDAHIKAGFAACAIAAAALLYLIACPASAAPYVLKFRNPSPTQAYTQLRTPWGIVDAPCSPGATCSVVIDAPLGPQTITAEATSDGALWSAKSNALEAMIFPPDSQCLAADVCAMDRDRNGSISVYDFGRLLKVLGASWIPSP